MSQSNTHRHPDPPFEHLIGAVIEGEWRIEGLLGSGGMAVVLAVTAISTGEELAIKILRTELRNNQEVCARFLSEFPISQQIDHPGIVKMYEAGWLETGEPFLVMERLAGKTVDEIWVEEGKKVDLHWVLAIADSTLDVLRVAHTRGVIHRDIKPENIFLVNGGGAKLIDFGVSGASHVNKDYVTRFGYTMGTTAFMPPEQALGKWNEVDVRADIFALAATMFLLLSGQTIHEPLAGEALLLAAMDHVAPPIRSVSPEVPQEVERLLAKALAPSRSHRYSSALEMHSDLKEIRARLALQSVE
jgi:eukaryotic-like serine/threonine-protein kinase